MKLMHMHFNNCYFIYKYFAHICIFKTFIYLAQIRFRRFSSASSVASRDMGTSFEEKPAVPIPPPPPPPPTPKMSTGQVSSDAVAAAVSAVLSQAVSDSEEELIVLSNDADFSKFMSQFEIQVKVANGMNKLKRIASQFPNYLIQVSFISLFIYLFIYYKLVLFVFSLLFLLQIYFIPITVLLSS